MATGFSDNLFDNQMAAPGITGFFAGFRVKCVPGQARGASNRPLQVTSEAGESCDCGGRRRSALPLQSLRVKRNALWNIIQ